jgi:hypothetical protein
MPLSNVPIVGASFVALSLELRVGNTKLAAPGTIFQRTPPNLAVQNNVALHTIHRRM